MKKNVRSRELLAVIFVLATLFPVGALAVGVSHYLSERAKKDAQAAAKKFLQGSVYANLDIAAVSPGDLHLYRPETNRVYYAPEVFSLKGITPQGECRQGGVATFSLVADNQYRNSGAHINDWFILLCR